MQIELTPYEMYTIMKNTTIKNTKKFMEDLETYKIKFHDILDILEDYETYFNTEIDLREETNNANIYIINIFEYKGHIKEFYNIINNYWSYEVKRGTYLIIE